MTERSKPHIEADPKLMAGAVEQSGEAIVLMDAAFRFLYVNPAFTELFAYSIDELLDKDWATLFPAFAMRGPGPGTLPETLAHAQGAKLEHAKAKSGQEIPVLLNIAPLKNEAGNVNGFVATITDVSALHQNERELHLPSSVFENAYDGVLITDADATILDVNPAFTRITGYEREEAIGRNPRLLQSGRQSREFYAAMWNHLQRSGYFRGELWNRRKDGAVYAQLTTIFAIRDDAGAILRYLGILNDITNLKLQTTELERLAHLDPLTGLPNRLLLADRLARAVAHARRTDKHFAVCFLDLDGFKAINDTYGHHVGDEVLIAVSRRLAECVRDGDTIARLGGDEFVLLLTELDEDADCERTLRRVMTVVADPIKVGDLSVSISLSIGVALYPADSDDADLLLGLADQTMYAAKQSGKNQYRFFSGRRPPARAGSTARGK